jgi:hypothetical protein
LRIEVGNAFKHLDELPLDANDTSIKVRKLLEDSLRKIQGARLAVLSRASIGNPGGSSLAIGLNTNFTAALGGTAHLSGIHGDNHVIGIKGGTAASDGIGEPSATTRVRSGRGIGNGNILLIGQGDFGSGGVTSSGGDGRSRRDSDEGSGGQKSELVEDHGVDVLG